VRLKLIFRPGRTLALERYPSLSLVRNFSLPSNFF
jgi:hypothetical protein